MLAGFGLRIGEHFAGEVNDSGPSARGLAFLGGNLGESVGAVGFDAVREKESLLGKVALDFRAQGGFPSAAQHDIEYGGGGGDHDQEDGQQFEENAVLHLRSHLGTSKR